MPLLCEEWNNVLEAALGLVKPVLNKTLECPQAILWVLEEWPEVGEEGGEGGGVGR